jgi:hypothetical protein
MSYKNRVLSDRPLGYWRLRSYGIWDETLTNNGSVIGGSAPLFTDVLSITSNSFSDTEISGCYMTTSSAFSINNNYNFFTKGFENSTFGIEFWLKLESNPATKTTIFSALNQSGTSIASIYVQADSIYFDLGTGVTKKQVITWSNPVHVFASYKEKTIEIFVNGLSDESIKLNNTFAFIATSGSFQVGPASTSSTYILNDLAFYSKKLSLNEIRSHMVWANRDSDPDSYVSQGSAYGFTLANKNSMFAYREIFGTKDAYDKGYYNNLISDGSGLTFTKTTSSQVGYGEWTYNLPINEYVGFVGSDISWSTGSPEGSVTNSKYINVLASYDNGLTYQQVFNNQVVPQFLTTASSLASANLMVKVQIYSPDTSLTNQPRIDNLSIGVYKNLDIISDTGNFVISQTGTGTYNIQKDKKSILARSKNFGIVFKSQENGGSPGKAIISSTVNQYQSLEFWFRYNSISGSSAICNGVYIDGTTKMVKSNLPSGGKVYINGVDCTSGTKVLDTRHTYHIMVVWPSAQNSPIYLNYNSTYSPLDSIFGYVNIYPNQLSSTQVQTRYLSYLCINSAYVYDGSTSLGSLLEYAGTSSQINGGQPIISVERVM